ncbi:hypothetical protein ACFV7R_11775 [Streptomyces sp. NPDC059866]|uniref:hypothetical protein n=1 Tax=Streptomyces sp. NPDC059866 TaxID=3346978 RepID=UPI00365C2222
MQISGVEVYVNHPVLHLGATDWVPVSLELGDADAASCETHVAVRVRAQSDLIRVRLFQDLGDSVCADPSFITVFDGQLLLDNGRLAVGDVEGLTRFVHQVGDRGAWNVRVAVDRPGWDARAIDVTVSRPAK